jgi:hypothetical protein
MSGTDTLLAAVAPRPRRQHERAPVARFSGVGKDASPTPRGDGRRSYGCQPPPERKPLFILRLRCRCPRVATSSLAAVEAGASAARRCPRLGRARQCSDRVASTLPGRCAIEAA